MSSKSILFKVHYEGKFDKYDGCVYVGGKVSNHTDPYDPNCLSFIDIEVVVKEYGYKSSGLLFYLEPKKTLSDGLRIISGDPNVFDMVAAYIGKDVVHFYAVGFESEPTEDPVDELNEEMERRHLGIGTK